MDYQDSFNEKLKEIFVKISKDFALPENTFSIKENYSKIGANAGNLISTEIDIQEYAYPPDNSITGTSLVLYLKPNKNYYELLIRRDRLSHILIPNTAKIKESSDKIYEHILFNFKDPSIYNFVETNILFCLENYTSSNTFSCCARYKECSASAKCLHPNTLYAKGCQYRKNLENGKIFY